jgi:UDP-3-O-[3-hydroxymyristoyl] glucosamine N-acyltransferase
MNLITDEQINHAGEGVLQFISGKSRGFDAVHSPEKSTPSSLVFISTPEFLDQAIKNEAQGFIVLEKKFSEFKSLIPESKTIWTTPHIQLAMTKILPLFDRKKNFLTNEGHHPTASIHPTANVASTAHIGPYAVIEAGASVGADAIIGAHTVIQAHAKVGDNSLLNPHVVIGAFCQVGNRCNIASHVSIGSDGFSFFTDKTGTHHKIPQIGKVVIEDDCELGAHCAVDRAALEETRIKKGTKLDNFCHIAHNVEFGENGLAAAAFKVAGSTKIGKNLLAAGNVDVRCCFKLG